MLVMTFPKLKELQSDIFFDRRFFELMHQFLYSKSFWKRKAARYALCRVYVAKFRKTFDKMEKAKMLAVKSLMQEFEETERARKLFIIEFFNLIMEEEVKRNG